MHFVYILASRPRGAIYVGLTNDPTRRLQQHRSGLGSVHTARYGIHTLVWFQTFDAFPEASEMERQLKRWRRVWKDQLIETCNPTWRDISDQIPMVYWA